MISPQANRLGRSSLLISIHHGLMQHSRALEVHYILRESSCEERTKNRGEHENQHTAKEGLDLSLLSSQTAGQVSSFRDQPNLERANPLSGHRGLQQRRLSHLQLGRATAASKQISAQAGHEGRKRDNAHKRYCLGSSQTCSCLIILLLLTVRYAQQFHNMSGVRGSAPVS